MIMDDRTTIMNAILIQLKEMNTHMEDISHSLRDIARKE